MKYKKDQQKSHARRRFSERLSVRLSQYLHDNLLYKIRNNEAKLIEKQSLRVKIYEITFTPRQEDVIDGTDPQPITVNIVYDSVRKNIVTVLFPGETNARTL